MKKKVFIGISILVAVVILILGVRAIGTSAKAVSEPTVRHTSYEIRPGDTLWGLAKAHAADVQMTTEAYIREVKTLNRLSSDCIYAGGHLILPVGGETP